jgi:hypothetical protein
MTRWGPYVEQRLDDIRQGKGREHWEGDWPAPAVADAAWTTAAETLPDEAPTPSVVPTEEGGIDLVWHKGGWDIEIEIDREGSALLWMWDRSDGPDDSGPLEEGRDRLRALLGELSKL